MLEGHDLKPWEVDAMDADLVDTLLIRLQIRGEIAAEQAQERKRRGK